MPLIKRLEKGSPLTFAEGDANLDYLEDLVESNSVVTLKFGDMQFSHVSGSGSYYAAVSSVLVPVLPSGFGAGVDASRNLTLTPTTSSVPTYSAFKSETSNLRVTGYRFYSNITGSDFPVYNFQSQGPNISFVAFGVAEKTGPNSATSAQLISREMYSLTAGTYDGADGEWSIVPTGSVKSASPEILDSGTIYSVGSMGSSPIDLGPNPYSPVYYTFLLSMGAGFATKTYKFRLELDCVRY